MSMNNVFIFARSNHGDRTVQHQLQQLRGYAQRHGLTVVGEVGLARTSANDPSVMDALTGLIARGTGRRMGETLLVADRSRLSRGAWRGAAVMARLAAAGWQVVVADDPPVAAEKRSDNSDI